MPESTHPISYMNEIPPQYEIKQHDIEEANKDTIATAVFNDIDRLEGVMRDSTSQAEREQYRKRIIEAKSVERALSAWDESNTFRDYVEQSELAEDAPQWASEATAWLDRSGYLIGEVMREKAEEDAAAETESFLPFIDEAPSQSESQQAAEKQQAVDNARASVERARGVEVFDDVVKLGKDKTRLHTDIAGGFKNIGNMKDGSRDNGAIPKNEVMDKEERNPDWHHHLNEAAMFTDLVAAQKRTIMHERDVPGKGLFSRSSKERYAVDEDIPGSEQPILIRNELTGQDEPGVRFRYQFKYSLAALHSNELPGYSEFKGNRHGQMIVACLDLPKSVADKLHAQVARDPKSVRTLVERLFLENSDGTMTAEYWKQGGEMKHPVRPPYENLPVGWNIALISGIETDKSRIPSYDVQRLKTTV